MARTRRSSARIAALAAALALAGCSLVEPPKPPPPCPRIAAVADAAKLTRFAGESRDLTDVLYEAEIIDFVGSCAYDDEGVDVATRVRFIASRGPADQAHRADFRYFVAVATRDKRIIGRQVFDSAIEFPGNQTRAGVVEELEQRIPLDAEGTGENYIIYVGFELSPDEVEFNRRQRQ